MKLALAGKAKGPTSLESLDGEAVEHFHLMKPEEVCGVKLFVEVVLAAFSIEKVSVKPGKVAFDTLVRNDLLDPVNGGRVCLDGKPGLFIAMPIRDAINAIVDRPG